MCWSTSSNPTISNAHTSDGSGIGSFTSQLTNLNPSTLYYVRAYAANSTSTAYGNQISFTTAVAPVPLINAVLNADVHDGDSGGGVGNADLKINRDEEIDLEVGIKNNGNGIAYNITGTLTYLGGTNASASITDSTEPLTSLAPGASDELDDFDFSVTGSAADGELRFRLTVTYEDEYGNPYSNVFTGGEMDLLVYRYGLRLPGQAGGLIFYDKGYSSSGWQYMEAAPYDQSSNIEWGGYGTLTGATATGIGTGEANTTTIVSILGTGTYAARTCYYLSLGGYSDWFLPSKWELNQMYTNLYTQGVGGFNVDWYWSSSEDHSTGSMMLDFSDGTLIDNGSKENLISVRAVRGF